MRQRIVHGTTIDTATPDEIAMLLESMKSLDTEITLIDTASPNAKREVLDQFPTETQRRVIMPRRPSGGQVAIDQAGETVVDANKARIGGQLVNIGANPVFLFLGTTNDHGQGQGWISASGGTWDFIISQKLWVGSVFCQCGPGLTTTIAVIEV